MEASAMPLIRSSVSMLAIVMLFGGPARPAAGQGADEGLPEVGGWSLGAPLLAPISEQAVAQLDGKVYMVGRYPGDRIPVDTASVFDPAANTWAPEPRFPVALPHA